MYLFKRKTKAHKSIPIPIPIPTKEETTRSLADLNIQIPTDETKAATLDELSMNCSSKALKDERFSKYLQSQSFVSSDDELDNKDEEVEDQEQDKDPYYLKFSNNKETELKAPNTARYGYEEKSSGPWSDLQSSPNNQQKLNFRDSYPDVYIYNLCKDRSPKMTDAELNNKNGSIEETQYLKLVLRKCQSFNPQQLSELANRIKSKTVNAKIISLNFLRCHEMTNSDLASLGASLGVGRRNIEYLSLDFLRCERISEHGIMNLVCGVVRDLSTIKSLRLRLRGCKEINDQTSHSLVARLCVELGGLKDLIVDFDVCGGVTQKGVKTLSEQITAKDCIVRLDHCEFKFYKWWWAPENCMQEIEAYIKRRKLRSSDHGVILVCAKVGCYANRIHSTNFEKNIVPVWSVENQDKRSRKTSLNDLSGKN